MNSEDMIVDPVLATAREGSSSPTPVPEDNILDDNVAAEPIADVMNVDNSVKHEKYRLGRTIYPVDEWWCGTNRMCKPIPVSRWEFEMLRGDLMHIEQKMIDGGRTVMIIGATVATMGLAGLIALSALSSVANIVSAFKK